MRQEVRAAISNYFRPFRLGFLGIQSQRNFRFEVRMRLIIFRVVFHYLVRGCEGGGLGPGGGFRFSFGAIRVVRGLSK